MAQGRSPPVGRLEVGGGADGGFESLGADQAELHAIGVGNNGDEQHAEPGLIVDLLKLVYDARGLLLRQPLVDPADWCHSAVRPTHRTPRAPQGAPADGGGRQREGVAAVPLLHADVALAYPGVHVQRLDGQRDVVAGKAERDGVADLGSQSPALVASALRRAGSTTCTRLWGVVAQCGGIQRRGIRWWRQSESPRPGPFGRQQGAGFAPCPASQCTMRRSGRGPARLPASQQGRCFVKFPSTYSSVSSRFLYQCKATATRSSNQRASPRAGRADGHPGEPQASLVSGLAELRQQKGVPIRADDLRCREVHALRPGVESYFSQGVQNSGQDSR